MDPDRARRAARLYAETARLMGVDFVPMYRVTQDEPEVLSPEAVAQEEPAPAVSVIEAKPERPADKRAALEALRARYEQEAPHKNFVTAFTKIVWGEGDPNARLIFIGEAPGEEEDREGRPFVGRSGQLLNKMIEAMGLTRESVYICNVLKTRPLNNATPTPNEIEACAPYLYEQVAIIDPECIVTLGLPAAKAVLRCPPTATMGSLRSRWAQMTLPNGKKIPVMPTYHPAFLLRSYTPENRQKVWSDLQQVMQRLGLKVKSPA
jgi:uracil-DNA glycosylase family 4